MIANVYVDAFNLYYGCLRKANKWLDIRKLCESRFPAHQIKHIHYFTAQVSARPSDPGQATRQQIYLRALRTTPDFTIHYGRYAINPCWMALENPPATGSRSVRVIKSEEKGSDVNIACRMLLDAFRAECEHMILLSNDSDLKEPVRAVVQDFGIPVHVWAPLFQTPLGTPGRHIASDLVSVATSTARMDATILAACQFANPLHDAKGAITKPASW